MSDLTELPEWLWKFLDALEEYEDVHSPLYRMVDSGQYERTQCIGAFLDERKAYPPREIREAAKFRRAVLRTAKGDA